RCDRVAGGPVELRVAHAGRSRGGTVGARSGARRRPRLAGGGWGQVQCRAAGGRRRVRGRSPGSAGGRARRAGSVSERRVVAAVPQSRGGTRSEEHTSELQSRGHLVCRLLLEKKKQTDRSTE